jgi:protein-L-isoaspartate(D-aspartate) O-methyltransferase
VEPGPRDDYRFVGYRRRLIEEVRARGIDDLEILQLLDRVPRHLFLPEGVWPRAYEDAAIPIGFGQTASQPSLQAYYLTLLKPGANDRVLEIGTGSGFLTALLALRADRVYSVERVRELSQRARIALDAMKLSNVALLVGDGTIGWKKFAPYDVIIVSAASPSVPDAFVQQLADGGRMLIPVGSLQEQELILVRKEKGEVTQEAVRGECTFVPLLGCFGWNADGTEGTA